MACVALLGNLLLTVALMVLINATFTLPGLAGIVLYTSLGGTTYSWSAPGMVALITPTGTRAAAARSVRAGQMSSLLKTRALGRSADMTAFA